MSLTVSRILHAGYIFKCDKTQIAFDPVFENPFSVNCHAFPGVRFDLEAVRKLKLDAVFISHFHDDHCSLESLNLLDRKTPIYLYCVHEEFFAMIRELGFENVHPLDLNIPVEVGPIEVIPRRALDADVDSMFHIKAEDFNILNVVDSWIDDTTIDQLAKTSWDLVLWPFQTMRELEVLSPSRAEPASETLPEEWYAQLKKLNPKYIVPSSCQFRLESWSWYNHAFFPISYKQFQTEIESLLPGVKVVRLNPSQSIFLNSESVDFSEPLSWIQPIGNQDVDYEYKKDLIPPPTAEIAKRFPALNEEQTKRVLQYCESEILEKYRSFGPTEYFSEHRIWHLLVYDNSGLYRIFVYEILDGTMNLCTEEMDPPSWTTEVIAFKLYTALEQGESLTSMYVRVNDGIFSSEIETVLKKAEILEDPLISCLFNESIGAYQAAQLMRLKEK